MMEQDASKQYDADVGDSESNVGERLAGSILSDSTTLEWEHRQGFRYRDVLDGCRLFRNKERNSS